jgi:molybdenum cofactor biosynthesis enzyme MoaA
MKNYCPLPFGHVCVGSLGTYQICCQHRVPAKHQNNISEVPVSQWTKNQYLEQVRDAFQQDQRHPGCAVCWRDEDSGKPSIRTRVSQEYQLIGLKPMEQRLVNIEIQAGNLCNLSCVMCDEAESSALLAENQRLGINQIQQTDIKWDEQAWKNLNEILPKVRVLNIRGGEPMYNKKLLETIESMPVEHCKNMLLHITTNATVWNERWETALKKFRLVRVMLSIDAVGDVYEYIRYPAQWNTVEQNVNRMLTMPNFKFTVHSVVQNLNVAHLEDLIDWCQSKNLFLEFQKCYRPQYLEPTNIPNSLIDSTVAQLKRCENKVIEANARAFIQSCLNDFETRRQTEINLDLWREFVSIITLRESLRGNNHKDILNY